MTINNNNFLTIMTQDKFEAFKKMNTNKAIAMIHGKSPHSELIF